ncbi:hypothetical protein, partial [Citrobacter freundii]|uniref:hypothetical protein n=1 Tax=Citrobacter freundii TaxID=546 RepID=UPI002F9639A5
GAMACTWGSRASASPGRQSSSVPCRWRGGAAAGKWRGISAAVRPEPGAMPAPGEAAPAHHRGGNPALYPAAGAAAQLPENGGASAQLCARNPARWQTLDERLSDAYTIRKKRW